MKNNQRLMPLFRSSVLPDRNVPVEWISYDLSSLLGALMRFSMALRVPPSDLDLVRPVERNCSNQISVINDIWSYEKEVLAAETLHEEGGTLCTAVAVLGPRGLRCNSCGVSLELKAGWDITC